MSTPDPLDLVSGAIADTAQQIAAIFQRGEVAGGAPTTEQIYDRIAEMYVGLTHSDSTMMHKYPILTVELANGDIGVFLQMGLIPKENL